MTGWDGLAPGFAWRKSQRHLLDLCAHVTDRRWHLCAPPGAGKTLVGLELARLIGGRTLVLSPTTAIRDQWLSATALFGADPDTFASTDLNQPAQLYSVTYQLLGNPGQAEEELRAAARRLWLAEVAARTGDAAEARVAVVEREDPKRAKQAINRHVRALRRSLATGERVGIDPAPLLGTGTTALIERLAAMEITCLVLDECHHLLDWWALVTSALVGRLGDEVAVIGLTATLPDPDTAREGLNYHGLLGPVDAELHLTAMVAEGGIAPWRDGVRVVELAPAEARFLDTWATSFGERLDTVLLDEPFIGWAVGRIEDAASDGEVTAAGWDGFWDTDPLVAVAVARWWSARGMALPAGFDPPPDADTDAPLTLDDRLLLVDAWLHAPDAAIPEETREYTHQILRRHGVGISTAGIRWTRSVADIVCSRSSAKGTAAGAILRQETESRGDGLRALVVVERDRATTPPAVAREVVGEDAGTAARVLAAVCAEGSVLAHGVLCVTGRGAWCDALGAERIVNAVNMSTSDGRWISSRGCDIPSAVRLTGHGPAWEPAHWLAAARAVLEDGVAHTMVATRGLVGEGWNYPGLNVVVDLSEVASPTAMTQLRGRALRLDHAAPDKVASLWDVVIAHRTAHGDWSRFRRKHTRWWGPDTDGAIVTGARKVDPLAATPVPPPAGLRAALNDASTARMLDRTGTARVWASVDPGGVATSELRFATRQGRRRVVRTRSARRWPEAVGAVALAGASGTASTAVGLGLAGYAGALVLAGGLLLAARRGRTRSDEGTVRVLGEAVAARLARAGHTGLGTALVTATADANGVAAVVHGVDDDMALLWAEAFDELTGPLGTPRWLLTTGQHAWRVPTVVGATRVWAEAFWHAFSQRVPGARLVHAGTPEATELTLRAARERRATAVHTLRWANR